MSHDSHPLVMVVDDESAVVRLVARALEPAGYRVLTATSGPEAIRIVEGLDGPVALLLTDLEMPEMTGRSLALELRKSQLGLKVLYLTGHVDGLFGFSTLLEPHEAFVEKPISGPALLEAVALHLFGTLRAPNEPAK